MNLDTVIARLESECLALKLVGGSANFEQAVAALATFPAAFVLPAKEAGAPNEWASQVVEQRVQVDFAVVLAVRDLTDSQGSKAHDALFPVRGPVRDALLNWTPDGCEEGISFVSGDLMAFDNGVLWWADTYRTGYMIRSA